LQEDTVIIKKTTQCSPLLIVNVIFVITVFFLFLLCVSTILVNKDDHYYSS